MAGCCDFSGPVTGVSGFLVAVGEMAAVLVPYGKHFCKQGGFRDG